MIAYALRRLLGAIPTLFVIVTLAFFMMRAAPGGPFDSERRLPPEVERNVKAAYNLDKPLTATAKVFPMLHLEDNNNTTYDFPNGDAPAKVGADVVVLPIEITVS